MHIYMHDICVCLYIDIYVCISIYSYVSLSLSLYIYIYIYMSYDHICMYIYKACSWRSAASSGGASACTSPGLSLGV